MTGTKELTPSESLPKILRSMQLMATALRTQQVGPRKEDRLWKEAVHEVRAEAQVSLLRVRPSRLRAADLRVGLAVSWPPSGRRPGVRLKVPVTLVLIST